MKTLIYILLILAVSNPRTNHAQNKHTTTDLPCLTCHTCEYPTAKNPCLIDCPRGDVITIRNSAKAAPVSIRLDQLKNRYQGVIFSHLRHAEMFDMSGGCSGCHHYNTTGPILACVSCHEASDKKTDIGKPGLEAAYHRLCINCHRTWSHTTDCQSCHPKDNFPTAKLSAKAHAVPVEPKKVLYETPYERGRLVTFYHSDHTERFGLSCANCHENTGCASCHDVKKNVSKPAEIIRRAGKTVDEKHSVCFSCHKNDACTLCHNNTELKPFNHETRTGWALKTYHNELACGNCHTNGKFTALSPNCENCHTQWKKGGFAHRVTGLTLDDNHNTLECDDCHTQRNFTIKPSCANCHDDKSYPQQKPGKTR